MAAATSCSVANEEDSDLLGGPLEGDDCKDDAVLASEGPPETEGEGTGDD